MNESIDKTANRSKTSRILDWEEEDAKKLILDKYTEDFKKACEASPHLRKKYENHPTGFYLPIAPDRHIIVALHVTREMLSECKNEITGEIKYLILPQSITSNSKFSACTGCVIAVAPDAYSDEKWYKSGPLVKVGDFVAFPRHAGNQYNFMGIPVHSIPANSPDMVLVGPDDVELY